jgi:hypothetical protein
MTLCRIRQAVRLPTRQERNIPGVILTTLIVGKRRQLDATRPKVGRCVRDFINRERNKLILRYDRY